MNDNYTYGNWIRQIGNGGGGCLGQVVIIITISCTGAGSWYGISLFPAGTYPEIILAIPGLMAGAAAFFVSSRLLWEIKKMF